MTSALQKSEDVAVQFLPLSESCTQLLPFACGMLQGWGLEGWGLGLADDCRRHLCGRHFRDFYDFFYRINQ